MNVADRLAMVPLGPDVTLTTGSVHSAGVTPSQAGFPALVSVPTKLPCQHIVLLRLQPRENASGQRQSRALT